MRCPFCGNEDTQVKDSRPAEDNSAIRRRRFCQACGSRFTTFERVQLRELTVVKKNGPRVPFDRDKLARSIFIATRKRPVEPDRVERMISPRGGHVGFIQGPFPGRTHSWLDGPPLDWLECQLPRPKGGG